MSQEIESKVSEILASANIEYSVIYCGETLHQDNWTCDEWKVTIVNGKKKETIRYYTGTGLREIIKGFKAISLPNAKVINGKWQASKPKAPHIAGIIYSMILDSNAANISFNDWCADYGYDNGSIKAQNTYFECQKQETKLRNIFNADTHAQLAEALLDY